MKQLFALVFLLCSTALAAIGAETPQPLTAERDPRLKTFATQKRQQMEELATKLHLDVPPEARKFFQAAEAGDWNAVSNRFEEVYHRAGVSEGSAPPLSLQNALFIPIHETWGAYATFRDWDGTMLQKFADGILGSIPTGSVYYGGTDAGRFVITAVRDVARSPDVFIITPKFITTPLRPPWKYSVTQKQLENSPYTDYLRLVYGGRLWIPSAVDMRNEFQQYVSAVQSRGQQTGAGLSTNKDGIVQISGVEAVVEINSIVTKMIFDRNKDKHEFYVEESYVIPWMYEYMEPHGLILKLNKEPMKVLDTAVVARDREYWNALTKELLADPRLLGNEGTRKTYAKLRSAIGGLYAYRRLRSEAEAAFKQAVELAPISPEANYRLAQLYAEQSRFDDAIAVLEQYQNRLSSTPDKQRTLQAITQLSEMKHRADEDKSKPVPFIQ